MYLENNVKRCCFNVVNFKTLDNMYIWEFIDKEMQINLRQIETIKSICLVLETVTKTKLIKA